jgi:hypothetical protein
MKNHTYIVKSQTGDYLYRGPSKSRAVAIRERRPDVWIYKLGRLQFVDFSGERPVMHDAHDGRT